MRVGWDNLQVNWTDVLSYALKFAVAVQVAHSKTASLVCVDHFFRFLQDRFVRSINSRSHSAVSHVAGYGMQKQQVLVDEQEINAQGHILMELEDWGRDGYHLLIA